MLEDLRGAATGDLLAAATDEVLSQLRAVPLIRSKVFRYLPAKSQRRIAGRIAIAVLGRVFGTALKSVYATDTDFAAKETRPQLVPEDPHLTLRWCAHCERERPTYYAELAFRCVKCKSATMRRRGQAPAEPEKRFTARREAGSA
ncbi:MAG: hypothetical protein GTO22_00390 [Gemmatimonadales bacterium]|nr:hypothetical protein [Gemmatimonadales bacterium]